MSFEADERRRPEVVAYMKRRRGEKQPATPRRRFIIEQEAARLGMYSLIGEMNALGIWGK